MYYDTDNTRARMKMAFMGQRIRAGYAKTEPTGDKMINAVRGAIWEAWEMGLDEDKGESVFPTIPLLDREPVEPEAPEI